MDAGGRATPGAVAEGGDEGHTVHPAALILSFSRGEKGRSPGVRGTGGAWGISTKQNEALH